MLCWEPGRGPNSSQSNEARVRAQAAASPQREQRREEDLHKANKHLTTKHKQREKVTTKTYNKNE